MEKFRKRMKTKRTLYLIFMLFAVAVGIYNVFRIDLTVQDSFSNSTVTSFQIGLIFGIGFLAVLQFVKLSKALKSEKKLQLLYNEAHDERMILIRSKAGMPMVLITSSIMIVAAIIAGYFNIVVFYTLLLAAIVQLTIGAAVKIYCMKKI